MKAKKYNQFLIAALLAVQSAHAQTSLTWNGGATDDNWSNAANWGGTAPISNEIFNFAGSTRLSPVNDIVGYNGYRIFFNTGASGFTLSGNALTLFDFGGAAPKIENNSANLQTINNNITLQGAAGSGVEINPVDESLVFGGTISLSTAGNSTLKIFGNNNKDVTFNGIISEAGSNGLSLLGSSNVIFGAANTYTGTTLVDFGTLRLASGGSITTSDIQVGIGATFDVNGQTTTVKSISEQGIADGGSIKLGSGSLTVNNAGAGTKFFNNLGIIGDTGNFTLNSTGSTLELYGASLYTGTTTVQAGTLNLQATATMASSAIVLSGGTLNAGGSNLLADTATVTVSGGTLALSTFSDTVGAVTLTGGSITGTTGALTGTSYALESGTASAILAGSGTVTKTTSGSVTLSGANTFSGQLTVQNGTLSIATANNVSAAGPLGNSALSVILGNTGAQTGTLSYTGATATSTKPFTLATGGTGAFDVTVAANTLTLSGAIGGDGKLSKSGPGTLILSGTNNYSGTTTVTTGRLQFNAITAIGGSGRSVTVDAGASVSAGFAITNAFLNRLAENSNTSNIHMAVASSNALDLSSSTGANLPNAVLYGQGNTAYTGTLTPAGNIYRLGNFAATWGNANTFTMSALTGAANSLVVSGTGLVVINSSSNYKGATTVNAGASFRYDGVLDSAGIGGGVGVRDITVGPGGNIARTGGSVNNAFLNRLVENNNDITIYMGNASCANNLDFSSSTGANLPNASIAFYDSAGTPSFQYTGTITPANNTYRLGGTKASAANNTSLSNVNALTGARSVVITGGNVRILNSNDFTGTITINAGNFNISGNVNASNATVNGNGSIGGGMYAGDIITNGTMIHSSSSTQTLSGLITGTGSVSRGSPGTAAPSGSTATPIDAGTLIITNPNNTYSGSTAASTGAISFNSIANVGGGASSLGAPTTIANGTIAVGGAFLTFRTSVPIITPRSGSLIYTGNGHTSDRVIDLAGTSGGATINSSGGGALELASNMTATGVGSKTLTLTGSNSNNNRIGGAIVNNSTSGSTTLSKSFETAANTVTLSSVDGISTGATITGTGIVASPATTITAINTATKIVTLSANTNATANNSIVGLYTITGVQNRTSLIKEGTGKWVLGGTNTFTGSTTVSGGTLMLDYSTNDNSKLSNTAVLTMAGGTLDLSGGTHTEVVASTTLAAGTASTITSSSLGSVLQMGLITANAGATLNITTPGIATTDSNNVNGILGVWATVGGADWAINSTDLALGSIAAYTGYTDIDARGPTSTIADGPATNVRIVADGASGNIALGASTVTINTLLQSNATIAATIDTASKNLITDAIWVPAGKAGIIIGATVGDGTLTPIASSGTLLLQNDSNNDQTINAVLSDNGSSLISKAGIGTLILNATNTYAGGTSLGAGTLVIGNSSALGTGPLSITGGSVAATGTQITTNPVNANGDFAIGGTGALTLGDMTLNANRNITNNNTISTTTLGYISGTTRNLTISGNGNTEVAGVIGTTTGTLTKNGSGSLTLSASNTYTGITTINGGTLQLGNGGSFGSIGSTASIINNAALAFNLDSPLTVNKIISGTGSVTQKGTGFSTLSVANSYTGSTIVSAGTLSVGVTANLGAPAANLVFDGGTLQITGTALTSFAGIGHAVSFNLNKNVYLDIANTNNTFVVDQVLNQGTGWFYKYGPGTAILTQANTMMPAGGSDYNGVAQGMLLATKFTAMPGIANDLWYAEAGATLAVRADDAGTNDEFTSANLDSLLGGAGTTDAFASGSYLGIEVIGSSTFTYAGDIAGTSLALDNVGKGLVKLGTGTLALTGTNTYTDTTSVRAGTLALIGGSHTSAITLSAGASLGFTLGSPTTTTQDVNIGLGTIKITGTPTLLSYDLITSASSINGTPVLASPVSGYDLVVESNVLKLKKAGYASWASTNTAGANLADDHDNDGVSNGIEYFLGGPAGNTTGFTTLPSVVKALDGTLSVTWPKGLNYAGVYSTDYVVETSATLTGVWTAETTGGGNITDSSTEVKFTFPGGPTYSGKNFARLRVTGP